MQYRPDIQGLRAVAILAVVAHHFAPDVVPGGFVGVDVFFVISGYLIAGIILEDIGAKRFSIVSFYGRRARRIIPPLLVMLSLSGVAAWWLLPPPNLSEFARTAAGASLSISNFVFLDLTDYFATDASTKPLLHTWSLGVEEQFYLVLPLLLILLGGASKKAITGILLALTAASLACSVIWTASNQPAAFYMLPSRAFEFLIGSALVVALPRLQIANLTREVIGTVGGGILFACIAFMSPSDSFPGFLAMAPCLGTAMVIMAKGSAASKVLEIRPMIFFGTISYSLYLWHWPVLVFSTYLHAGTDSSPTDIVVALAVALVLSVLSWGLVERPARHLRLRPLVTLSGAAAVSAAVVVAFSVIHFSGGVPSRFTTEQRALFWSARDVNPRRKECHDTYLSLAELCRFGSERAPADVAVWADSLGAELSVAIGDQLKGDFRSVVEVTSSACPPAVGFDVSSRPKCRSYNEEMLDSLVQSDAIETVVLVANYAHYGAGTEAPLLAGLEVSVRALRKAGKHVIFILPIPSMGVDPSTALGILAHQNRSLGSVGIHLSDHLKTNRSFIAAIRKLADEYGAELADPTAVLCRDDFCPAYDWEGNGKLYFDRAHPSVAGARKLLALFTLASTLEPRSAR